jgi:hypothetical protein
MIPYTATILLNMPFTINSTIPGIKKSENGAEGFK